MEKQCWRLIIPRLRTKELTAYAGQRWSFFTNFWQLNFHHSFSAIYLFRIRNKKLCKVSQEYFFPISTQWAINKYLWVFTSYGFQSFFSDTWWHFRCIVNLVSLVIKSLSRLKLDSQITFNWNLLPLFLVQTPFGDGWVYSTDS